MAIAPSGSTVYVRAGSYPYQKLHGIGDDARKEIRRISETYGFDLFGHRVSLRGSIGL